MAAGRKKTVFRKFLLIIGSAILLLLLSAAATFIFSPNICALKDKNPDYTAFMKIRKMEADSLHKKFFLRHDWTPLNRIPNILVEAVLSAEDDRFFEHHGFDWQELRQAFLGKSRRKTIRGASTISQQLVKNLYLSPKRSILRKMKEFILTIKLEFCLSKRRILECYLNVIELGNGIFGVEAASRHFFSKSVSDLSCTEMIRLAAVIPKPLKVSPLSDSKYIHWRMNWIGHRLKRKGVITDDQYREIIRQSR